MLSAVPTADVVVTNPTHYAVALKYDRGKDKAPIVLAKGERLFAKRIKDLAADHGVPMVENKPVARMLFTIRPRWQTDSNRTLSGCGGHSGLCLSHPSTLLPRTEAAQGWSSSEHSLRMGKSRANSE